MTPRRSDRSIGHDSEPRLNNETIKWIDRWAGNLVCAALTAHRAVNLGCRRVRAWLTRRPALPDQPPRRVLFLKLIEQGATVLAASALQKAVARVGREHVYFCVFAENRAILDVLDLVPAENVLEIRHATLGLLLRDSFRALRRIRGLGVDTVVDMELMARAPAIFAYLTGAVRRVGLHRFTAEGPYRGDLMTHRVQYNPYLHTSVAYALLVDALDADPHEWPLNKVPTPAMPAPFMFVPSPHDVARVRRILSEVGVGAGPLVVLNPNTGDLLPMRMWPTARFVELGKRILAENPTVTVVVTGAPSERIGAEQVCRDVGTDRVVSVAGRTTLRDVLVLYTLAEVLVTNDSGPGHFATMTDIVNVVLFGPEAPLLFGPLGQRGQVLWAGLACSPCVNPYNHRFSPCTNNRCMQAITVDAVYQRVRLGLARPERLPPGAAIGGHS